MSALEEKVARAIYEYRNPFGCRIPSTTHLLYVGEARAAIATMLAEMANPSPHMLDEAWAYALAEDAEGVWRAMLAAFKEERL